MSVYKTCRQSLDEANGRACAFCAHFSGPGYSNYAAYLGDGPPPSGFCDISVSDPRVVVPDSFRCEYEGVKATAGRTCAFFEAGRDPSADTYLDSPDLG